MVGSALIPASLQSWSLISLGLCRAVWVCVDAQLAKLYNEVDGVDGDLDLDLEMNWAALKTVQAHAVPRTQCWQTSTRIRELSKPCAFAARGFTETFAQN